MAYGRRYRKRRYPSRKRQMRPRYRGRYRKWNNRFSGAMVPELKNFDRALSFTFDNTAEVPSTGDALVSIPLGDSGTSRDGRRVIIKSLQIQGSLTLSQGTTNTERAVLCYMYVVQDTQCNGASPAVTDVLTSASLNDALVNLDNSNRFKILKKFVYNLQPTYTSYPDETGVVIKNLSYYRKCRIPINFDGTTDAITSLTSNNIFLIAGSVGANSDDTVTFAGVSRVRFFD